MEYREIEVEKIDVGEANVRKHDREVELNDLARSIEQWGVLQPVLVLPKDKRYDLIVGQRRFLACKRLGKEAIPAVILEDRDEVEAKILSISENMQRVELTRADKVDVIAFLYKHFGSVREVAKTLGISGQTVRNYLPLALYGPDELKKMVADKRITIGDATRVAKIAGEDEKKAMELAQDIGKYTKHEKARLEDVGTRKPELSAKELKKEAKRAKVLETLVVPLTVRMAEALDNASADMEMEREDIGKTALIEWLGRKGFWMRP